MSSDLPGALILAGAASAGKAPIAAAVVLEPPAFVPEVLRPTTDLAAPLPEALANALQRLCVSRIDPTAGTPAYCDRILSTNGAGLDARGRTMLAEDLKHARMAPYGRAITANMAATETTYPIPATRQAVVPMLPEDPVGADHPRALVGGAAALA